MYKLSVPISIDVLTEETLPLALQTIRQCGAERVFLAILESVYSQEASLYTMPERIEKTIRYFQKNGLEVGIWMNAFGHGSALSYQSEGTDIPFTPMEGVNGDKYTEGYCPLDENFAAHYSRAVRTVARMRPDMIMLDDDFRLNTRLYYMGCFCPLHLAEFYKRIGDANPREKPETHMLTGRKNKYRSAYMALAADTLLNFAAMLRRTVDEEAPQVRLGLCVCNENWDYNGTDAIQIARALAGDTAPFLRLNGAPYWGDCIIEVIEDSRMEFSWCKAAGIESFSEGDTYPRPRYKVPANRLELFDLALRCDGTGDGILKYMFDYSLAFTYETGYADRHIRNQTLRDQIQEIFEHKTPVGVQPVNILHKIENWHLPERCPEKVANRLMESCRSVSRHLLARNSIPTAYTAGEYPLLLCGENARYIQKEGLKNGAILDVPAAKILQERGIDAGLISTKQQSFFGERFLRQRDEIYGVDNGGLQAIGCSDRAEVCSVFTPGDSPASYLYENAEGLRFLVLTYDHYFSDPNRNYDNNYYRQALLVDAIEWMCGKRLPAFCPKNPDLYILSSKAGDAMSVALINANMDGVLSPVIRLDKVYSNIRFINCNGELLGDRVALEDIPPYGFAAFEVK